MNWPDYIIKAAKHSKGNARHWFRYLRKDIDKCGTFFSKQDVEDLYNNEALTPFQRVSIKAAFEEGSPTREHIQGLNKKAKRNKILLVQEKYENRLASVREQGIIDTGKISKHDNNEQPFELLSVIAGMKFDNDISELLDDYEKAHGMDCLDEFFINNQDKLRNYY